MDGSEFFSKRRSKVKMAKSQASSNFDRQKRNVAYYLSKVNHS